MTYRNRKLLDLCHEAPCFLRLSESGCGNDKSVPCHSDSLADGRGGYHKSHDCLAVPGCPVCHALFTRAHLGRPNYEYHHAKALKRFIVWAWENDKLRVA